MRDAGGIDVAYETKVDKTHPAVGTEQASVRVRIGTAEDAGRDDELASVEEFTP